MWVHPVPDAQHDLSNQRAPNEEKDFNEYSPGAPVVQMKFRHIAARRL